MLNELRTFLRDLGKVQHPCHGERRRKWEHHACSCCRNHQEAVVALSLTPSHGDLVFQHCVTSLCSSSHSELGLQLVTDLLTLRDSSYWLVRTELLETLAEIDFR